jgi:hypothetical protein
MWGDAHRAAGTHRTHNATRKRNNTALKRASGVWA